MSVTLNPPCDTTRWKPEEQPNPFSDLAKAFGNNDQTTNDAASAETSAASKAAAGKKSSKRTARVK